MSGRDSVRKLRKHAEDTGNAELTRVADALDAVLDDVEKPAPAPKSKKKKDEDE